MKNLSQKEYNYLIEKGIIKEGTGLCLKGYNMDFRVEKVDKNDKGYFLIISQLWGAKVKQFTFNNYSLIEMIDEMDVQRVIDAYTMNDELNLHEVSKSTDISTMELIEGKEIVDGVTAEEGLKIIFYNDKTPKNNNKIFTLKESNGKLKLVAPRGRPKKIR